MTAATMTLPTGAHAPAAAPMTLAVTSVRLHPAPGEGKVVAFATVVLNAAVAITGVGVVGAAGGRRVVLMPHRRRTDRCPACRFRTAIDARFCSCCGVRLADGRATAGADGRTRTTWDVAYPISGEARRVIEDAVLAALDGQGTDTPEGPAS